MSKLVEQALSRESREQTVVYFAVTPEEVEQGYIHYPKNSEFTHKAVHKDLDILRGFLKLKFPDSFNSFRYIEIPVDELVIDTSVHNRHNGVVAARLPIYYKFDPDEVHELF